MQYSWLKKKYSSIGLLSNLVSNGTLTFASFNTFTFNSAEKLFPFKEIRRFIQRHVISFIVVCFIFFKDGGFMELSISF